MGATTVNGNLKDAGFSNYASQVIYFRLKSAGTDSAATTVVARNRVSVTTDASGDFSISLWCNGLSDISSVYEVTLPDGERKEFIIPSASDGGSIELDRLLALHQPDGTSQIATLGDVFLEEANNLSDLASAPTARTNLGLGTMATQNASSVAITGGSVAGITDVAVADGGTGASTAATARANLGLTIGTQVQAWDAQLDDIAALSPSDEAVIRGNGTGWVVATNLRVDAGTNNSGIAMGNCIANGVQAVASGAQCSASGAQSNARGIDTTASGTAATAEGRLSLASGDYSSVTGRQSRAVHDGARVESDSQNADVSSTTTDQFTARFQNGYEFKGGNANFDGNISYVNPIVKPSTSTTLTAGSQVKVSQTASGITTTLWTSASDGQEVTIHNYSGGNNTIAAAAGIKSSSAGTDTSVTIFNNEVLKFIYDGTNWLLTT